MRVRIYHGPLRFDAKGGSTEGETMHGDASGQGLKLDDGRLVFIPMHNTLSVEFLDADEEDDE